MDRSLQKLLKKSEVIRQEQRENFQRLEEQLEKQRRNEDEVITVEITFHDTDTRLSLTGKLKQSEDCTATLEDVGRVICRVIKGDGVGKGYGSRHADIYRCISKGTLVQSFYGIAKLNGRQFAVMEDLQDNPTIAAAIKSNDQYEPLACIRFAYELAHTVAYLHSVGIVIKNISDTNVVVVKTEDGGGIRPRLMNLEQARRVSTKTFSVVGAQTRHDIDFRIDCRCNSI